MRTKKICFDRKKLIKLRLNSALTLRELALEVDIEHSAISRIENGDLGNPTFDYVYKLATFFSVPVDYFMIESPDIELSGVWTSDENGVVIEFLPGRKYSYRVGRMDYSGVYKTRRTEGPAIEVELSFNPKEIRVLFMDTNNIVIERKYYARKIA
jgi:transcriptional regulator with XRE-family HTH domain